MTDMLTETKKFNRLKESLFTGLNDTHRKRFNLLADNARAYHVKFCESASVGTTSAGNIATLNKVILPIIRRIMPTVIANELVGVQPMSGPVAQIQTMRFVYANSKSGLTAGTEALSPFAIASGYSGDEDTTSYNSGSASPTSTLEGRKGNEMSMQILKQVVNAQTRKLSAGWTFEAAQDAQSQYAVDTEAEIVTAVATEIVSEIDQDILGKLFTLAGDPSSTYDQEKARANRAPSYVGEEHANLASIINLGVNRIADRSRMGAGNWMVISTSVLTALQSATSSVIARTTEGPFEAPLNTKYVGLLNGAVKVYVNPYVGNDNTVLIGYKGSETQAAAFYCPYIPLMTTGTVLNPVNFELTMGFMTRYGYTQLQNQASSLGNAADYLYKIAVENLTFN